MKYFIKYIGVFVLFASMLVSCDQHPSLQKYYVDSNDNPEFVNFDIPASIIQLKDENVSEETRKTLESIKKVNILGYQLKENNKENFKVEKQKVREILKNPKYQDLITIGHGKQSYTVKFLGEENAIDEVIFFGTDIERGFALVRVLGNDMDPSKMMSLAQQIKLDNSDGSMEQLESLLKGFN